MHLVISVGLLLLFKFMGPTVTAKQPVEDVAVAAEDQVEPPPPPDDLTKVDEGLDSSIETALPLEREEQINVEEVVTKDEAIGSAMAVESVPMDSLKALGAPVDLLTGGNPIEGAGFGTLGDGGMGGLVGGNPNVAGRSGATKNKLL
jgi:hypothetical protein